MTEQIAGGEATVIEPTTTAPEAVVLSPEVVTETPARDYDAEAKDMGWVPENEFRGPKERWKPAQQFVEDGENILPIVRADNKKLRAQIEAMEKDYATRFERLDKAAQVTIKAAKAQFDRELADLQTKREEAVKAGDVQAFKAADKQIVDHAANAPKVEDFEAPKPEVQTTEHKEAVQTKWQETNDWFGKDYQLTGAAIGFSQALAMENPSISIEDNLKQTDEYMRKQFPIKFAGKSGANGHAPVDGGGEPKTPARTDTLAAKLPAEARAFAAQQVKDGVFKTVEEYAKLYFGS